MSKELVEKTIDTLTQAAKAYYIDHENSPLTDAEFDSQIDYLTSIAPQYPQLFAPGTPGHALIHPTPSFGTQVTTTDKITHDIPMLSLKKIKTQTELESYLNSATTAGATSFDIEAKLDGFAIDALYEGGKLTRLATRGDGNEGEDITYLTSSSLTITGLPHTIPTTDTLNIRGELYIDNDQLKAANKTRTKVGEEPFTANRNAIVGLMKAAKLGLDNTYEASFNAYSAFDQNNQYLNPQDPRLSTISLVSTTTADNVNYPTRSLTPNQVWPTVEKLQSDRLNFNFPTDGIVIKANPVTLMTTMGSTAHHPRAQVAFKYESEFATTTITDVVYQVGKSGKITPVAIIDPVTISQATISRVSLHNFNWVRSMGITIGALVEITRANEVIPYIQKVISTPTGATIINPPAQCPSCGSLTAPNGAYWVCNGDNCVAQEYAKIEHAAKRNYLDIDSLAGSTLTMLIDNGIVSSLPDIYDIKVSDIENLPFGNNGQTFGTTRATTLVNEINKSKDVPLSRALPALGIPHLGRTITKKLLKFYPTIDDILTMQEDEIIDIEGIGDITAKAIISGIQNNKDMILRLKNHGLFHSTPQTHNTNFSHSVSITGSVPPGYPNRARFVEAIEALGGEFHSSPKSGTDIVIGDKLSGSSKMVKARKLGLTILSPEEFLTTYPQFIVQ